MTLRMNRITANSKNATLHPTRFLPLLILALCLFPSTGQACTSPPDELMVHRNFAGGSVVDMTGLAAGTTNEPVMVAVTHQRLTDDQVEIAPAQNVMVTAASSTFTFSGTGNWFDATLWSPSFPGTFLPQGSIININDNCSADAGINIPGTLNISAGSTLAIGGALTFGNLQTCENNTLRNGNLNNNGTLNNNSFMIIAAGTINNNGTLNNRGSIDNSGQLTNSGTLNNSTGSLLNRANFDNFSLLINSGFIGNNGLMSNHGTLENSGTFTFVNKLLV